MKQILLSLIASTLGLLLVLPAHALDSSDSVFREAAAMPVPEGGIKDYPSYFLKPDQLKECLAIETSMNMLTGYLQKRDSLFTDMQFELEDIQAEIDKVDAYFRNNPNTKIDDKENFETRNKMVRRNNALVEQYNKKLADYTTLQNAYNKDVADFNSLSGTFEKSCNGKRYYADDLRKIRETE